MELFKLHWRLLNQNARQVFPRQFLKALGVDFGGTVDKNVPPMQGTWVQSLVGEDPTCSRVTKPIHHNL